MLKRNMKWIIYLLSFILLTSGFVEQSSVKVMQIFNSNYMSPIVMVPGSSAGENRFDYLISNLPREKNHFKHSVLKVEVDENGKMKFHGGILSIDNQPIIVVSFQIIAMDIGTSINRPNYLVKLCKVYKPNMALQILGLLDIQMVV